MPKKTVPNEAFIARVNQRQQEKLDEIRQTPPQGRTVTHQGRTFIVHRGVFWPFYDNPLLDVMHRIIPPGGRVLDIGTGTGIMAIFAAHAGAGHVTALDISSAAVACARENVTRHGLENKVHVQASDVFGALTPSERFHVIMANLPFRDKPAADTLEASMWDEGLKVHHAFFEGLDCHLAPEGRAYLCQANFGAVNEMKKLARESGFSIRRLATKKYPAKHELAGYEFYAYEIKRKSSR